jgi:hypothetical protein
MPQARSQLWLRRTFLPRELAKLQEGFIPESMDDRWFVFMEDDWVYFHRSWTGSCIYQVRLSGNTIAEAWVNGDPSAYSSDGDESERTILESLLDEFSGKRR